MSSHDASLAAFRKAILIGGPPRLGPQARPGALPIAVLNSALDELFASHSVDRTIQPELRSAALLWHDHLDASHTISQGIETPDGSWLHGIMHRREPDYGNAKYWFRRAGQHDAFPAIAERVAKLLHHDGNELTERLIENGEWMPLAFVDECESAEATGAPEQLNRLRHIQSIELDVLIEHILSH